GQTAAKHHESEEITLPETPQEHDKGKIIGRIFPVRRLVHAADKIPGTISLIRLPQAGPAKPPHIAARIKQISSSPTGWAIGNSGSMATQRMSVACDRTS